MNVLVVSDTLLAGGAEWFILRKCRALMQNGHKVILFTVRPDKVDNRLVEQFPEITIRSAPVNCIRYSIFGDRLLNKAFKRPAALNAVNRRHLKNLIQTFKPDVIHSHLLQADYKVHLAIRKSAIKQVVTIHGDYIEHIKRNDQHLYPHMLAVLNNAHAVVIISEEQRRILSEFCPAIKNKLHKIYNGYTTPPATDEGSSDGILRFGLIARGIPEKGWEPAIQAFTKIANSNTRLLLFGEGPHLQQLKEQTADQRVEFCGFTSNPIAAVKQMDIGLFPSTYKSESLPTTVIEYLMMNRPVITTDVGECREMIRMGDEFAGIVLDVNNGSVDINQLQTALESMITNTDQRKAFIQLASQAKLKFEMNKCIADYVKVYQ